MAIARIIVAPKGKGKSDIFKIFNLEFAGEKIPNLSSLFPIFANPETMKIVKKMPDRRKFKEVMYHNGVIDPQQDAILELCQHKGIPAEAARVSYRYYGKHMDGLYVNKLVHVAFEEEPVLETLKPRGVRQPMQFYNLIGLNDDALEKISADRELHLSLSKMKKLQEFQVRLGLEKVSDVYLETFGASWSEHCFHDLWKSLGLFKMLKEATEKIGNPNLISAFVDNAGVWDFYDGLCILFKLETHNSPSKSEPYGGQLTKLGGVIRDILENGLGAKPIGNIEMTVIGELKRKRYPELSGKTLPEEIIGRETIQAIADYGNPMGIPMTWARMMSHPDFSGKPFALGGTLGITTRAAAKKGEPQKGDLAVLVGNDTGNDGLHGATISSSGITDQTDTGDSTHVQIGRPYIEQLMMRAGLELMDRKCCRARNDFGAAGVVSAFGELGKNTNGVGGLIFNLARVLLKCPGLSNWQIALSESQERFAHVIIPEKKDEAMKIYRKYGLKATVVGVFTDNGRFQMFYDPEVNHFYLDMPLSGEICFDVPYSYFDECPLDKVEVVKPEPKSENVFYPEINHNNVMEMALGVAGHFDVCCQAKATTQYDSTVQGITWQGPLYGRNYNVPSSLGVLRPVFGQDYGMTISLSFSPWQFEVDPVNAAKNAVMDALTTQVIAGVNPRDVGMADNFYTDGVDPVARWYLCEQVKAITDISVKTGSPFMVGKDSSAGRGKFGGRIVCVPPCVAITAMGKIKDVNRLVLHQWQKPGNFLLAVGPRATRLDGSILSSALGITGAKMDDLTEQIDLGVYFRRLFQICSSGFVCSTVPINRGGIFMRLFEGIEASGWGVKTSLSSTEIFLENFGGALLEVDPAYVEWILKSFSDLHPAVIGEIIPWRRFTVQGKTLNLKFLRNAWKNNFEKALWGNGEEVA